MRKWLLRFLLIILALPLLAYGALQLPVVKRQLTSLAEDMLSSEQEQWKISGLSGHIPFNMRLDKVQASNAEGVWLELEQLHLAANPFAYLWNVISIEALEAKAIRLHRLPASEEEQPEAEDTEEDGKMLSEQLAGLPAIEIGHIRMDEILLPAELTGGRDTLWQLTAKGGLAGEKQHWQARLHTLDGIHTLLTAEANLAENLHLSLQLEEEAGGVIAELAGLGGVDAPMQAELHFRENRYEVAGTASASIGDISLLQLELNKSGENSVLQASGYLPKSWTGDISLPAREWELLATGYDTRKAFALNALQWQLAGLRLYGSAFYDKETDVIDDAYLLLRIRDASEWQTTLGQPLQGDIALTAEATGALEAAELRLEVLSEQLQLAGTTLHDTDALLHLTTNVRQWMDEGWAAADYHLDAESQLAGRSLALDAEGMIEETPAITISEGMVTLDEQQLTFSGDYGLKNGTMTLAAESERLALQPLTGGVMQGNVSLELAADGTLQRLPISLSVQASDLQELPSPFSQWMGQTATLEAEALLTDKAFTLEQFNLQSGELTASAEAALPLAAEAQAADITLKVTHPDYVPITLDAEVEQTPEWLQFRDILFNAGDMQIAGYAMLHQQQPDIEAELNINGESLAGLLAWAGQTDASGSLNGQIQVNGQSATASLQLANLSLPNANITIEQGELQANLDNFSTMEGLEAEARLSDADMAGTHLYNAVLNANSTGGLESAIEVTTDITAGLATDTLQLTSAFTVSQQEEMLNVTLSRLSADKGGLVLSLANPPTTFTLNQNTGAMRLTETTLTLAGEEIRLAADVTDTKVNAYLRSDPMPLQPLLAGSGIAIPESALTLALEASGKAAAPLITADIHLKAEELAGRDKPMALHLTGKWNNSATNPAIVAELAALFAEQQVMDGNARLPASLSLAPFAFQLKENKPLEGKATLELALSYLDVFLEPMGHQLAGTLSGEMQLGGTAASPAWDASLAVQNGSYDHLTYGACLRDIDMQLRADEAQLNLTKLNATGMNQTGRLQGGGSYSLDTEAIDMQVSMENLAAFCGGMAEGKVAGNISVTGDGEAMLAAGELRLSPLEIIIPAGGGGDIPDIPYVYRSQLDDQKEAEDEPIPSPLKLDIAVRMPQRVFVRGRGVDAELEGKLDIAGDAADPVINGSLNTIRGTLEVVGSTLTISKGQVRFLNGNPSQPYIDMLATTQAGSVEINVSVEGVVSKPDVLLYSNPSLPQDELLALLIFGRPLAQITPFQAVQLAQAAAMLAGQGGGGKGLLGNIRDELGVDTLTIGADEQGGATVGAGKYISDKVFVGVEQGTTPESRRFTTEIEVTPELRATTATTTQGAPSVGFQWQRDY